MSWPSSAPLNLQCSFRATVWCISDDGLMEVLIAWALQATEIIHRSKVTQGELRYEGRVIFFLSGRLVNVTWLSDIHPSCWIMSVTGSKRPSVDLWSRLTSSTHLCKCAWLGHCMIMWPCCRFITLPLSPWWGFLSCVEHILSFYFLFAKKKINHDKNTQTQNVHCHAYQIVCSALSFFVSQVNTVKYIQWMIFQ